MSSLRTRLLVFAVLVSMLALSEQAFPQDVLTGTITGRAMDSGGALIPGVEVTVSSPAMISGSRNTVTDEQGLYRFTLLAAPGVYRVTFTLPGFKTLNIDGVNIAVGATMTINGTMEVGGITDEVTVTSEAPTIDLQAATLAVNFNFNQTLEKLPYSKGIKALAMLTPGFSVSQYDVGGSVFATAASFSGRWHGRRGGEIISYDGVQWQTMFGDHSSYEEVNVSSAAKGAEAYSVGASINFVIKSGGNDFHGGGYAAWQDDSFQGNNVGQKLFDRGFSRTQKSNKMTRYNDFNFNIGGPIKRDKLWFYTSYSDTYSGQLVPGFLDLRTGNPATYYIRVYGPTLKLTHQLTEKTKLEAVGQFTRKIHAHWDASEFVPLESTRYQDFLGGVAKLNWTHIPNAKMTFDASMQRGGYWWPSTSWTEDVRRTDLTTGHTRGMWGHIYQRPIRWIWNGSWSWFTEIGGKNNEIKSGFMGWWDKRFDEDFGYRNHQIYRYRSRVDDTDYFLRPDSVVVHDTPNFKASGENYSSWFINDKITWNRKLTLNIGLRYDRTSSWLPEQGNPGTGPFATKFLFPERRDFPVYNSWVPRLSMVYDVTGEGRLALKASYGRYYIAGPSASLVNPAATTISTYSNWDGVIPYVPRPENLASITGGRGTRFDTNLDNAYLDEYSGGVELGLSRDYVFRFNVIRKMDYGGFKTINLAQPYAAFTDVRLAVDPGKDNIEGTADDGTMQAWSVPRTYPGFGRVDEIITNVAENEGNDLYTAYDVAFNKQFSRGWSLLATYSASYAKIRNNQPQNPNELVYNWQQPEWHYTWRINGTYELPWGVRLAAAYNAQSGEYYPREALMRNALNSTVRIRTEGQAGRYDYVKLFDTRVSKTFRINDNHSLEGIWDYFNVLNSSVVLRQVTTNGADYGRVLSQAGGSDVSMPVIPPRVFRLAVRWKF